MRKKGTIDAAGAAKPTPEEEPEEDIIIVFIPTMCPEVSSKGPPEFPGLIAASV